MGVVGWREDKRKMSVQPYVMDIEKTEIWITCNEPLEGDGRAVRGFLGNMYRNRPEFHGHIGDRLIYRHPLIQYKIFGGSALVVGLKDGAYLLKAVPRLKFIEIYFKKHFIIKQSTTNLFVSFGLAENTVKYTFVTPWIGLNKKNYQRYLKLKEKRKNTTDMLNEILKANIISMCKSVGYTAKSEIKVKSDLKEVSAVEVKEGVRLTAFKGNFKTNFVIPEFWGIGGKVSLGYGTVKCINGGNILNGSN
ncbi:MAG: CRISPR-associated endonuclease Cas6 [Nitrospirae bacterium]|nr:CRISPR-associated endonuclease Cas6 [Nitrospirota bacterium]